MVHIVSDADVPWMSIKYCQYVQYWQVYFGFFLLIYPIWNFPLTKERKKISAGISSKGSLPCLNTLSSNSFSAKWSCDYIFLFLFFTPSVSLYTYLPWFSFAIFNELSHCLERCFRNISWTTLNIFVSWPEQTTLMLSWTPSHFLNWLKSSGPSRDPRGTYIHDPPLWDLPFYPNPVLSFFPIGFQSWKGLLSGVFEAGQCQKPFGNLGSQGVPPLTPVHTFIDAFRELWTVCETGLAFADAPWIIFPLGFCTHDSVIFRDVIPWLSRAKLTGLTVVWELPHPSPLGMLVAVQKPLEGPPPAPLSYSEEVVPFPQEMVEGE